MSNGHVVSSLLLVCLGFVSGCFDRQFTWVDEEMTVYLHESNQKITSFNLSPSAEEYETIKKLLINSQNEWNDDFITYAPNMFLYNEKMQLNLLDDRVVINYVNPKGKNIQCVWLPSGQEMTDFNICKMKIRKRGATSGVNVSPNFQ